MRRQILARTAPVLIGAVSILAACSIQEPQLPIVTTEWVLPLGTIERTIAELIEDEDGLSILEGDVVAVHASGELDSVAVNERLDIDVDGVLVESEVGNIELDAADPATFAFTLAELAPGLSSPTPIPVPPFQFDVESGSQDIPGFSYAEVVAGTLAITLQNGLPVPVGGGSPPDQIVMQLRDAQSGQAILGHTFPSEVAPSASTVVALDLAGTTLPDSLLVTLTGGSPGSSGQAVPVDPSAELSIEAQVQNLIVGGALAPVPAQSFTDSSYVDLTDSILIQQAVVATGELALRVVNDLQVPVTAQLRFPDILDTEGNVMTMDVPLAARDAINVAADLTDHVLDFGTSFGEQLLVETFASTVGSGDDSVWIYATDQLIANVLPTELTFRQITGALEPYEIEFDASSIDVDIPDDIDSMEFSQVELAITMRSSLAVPGFVDFELTGQNDEGQEVPFVGRVPLPDLGTSKAMVEETVIFDQDNSNLLTFLNNLPVLIETRGTAVLGDGVSIGAVSPGDGVVARYELSAPLSIAFGAQEIALDPESVDLDEDLRETIHDHVVEGAIEVDATSTMPVAVDAWLHLDSDPARVETDPRIRLGPIALPAAPPVVAGQGRIAAEMTSIASLDAATIELLTGPQLHQIVILEFPGTDGEFVTLRSTDRVDIRGRLRASIQLGD